MGKRKGSANTEHVYATWIESDADKKKGKNINTEDGDMVMQSPW